MTATILEQARSGDEDAFRLLVEPYRRELQVHCYRLLGSVQDAEDLVQETMLAAWRGLGEFEERASVRAWLYKIATNRCLNAIRDGNRRPQPAPATVGAASRPAPTRLSEPVWLEPFPDSLLGDLPDAAPGPEARYETREALGLAFVAGLQQLPARQRAVLVLRDVLGFRAAEAAQILASTEVSVNSALQRARATLAAQVSRDRERPSLPNSPQERVIVGQFVEAFENADVERLVALLADDAWLTMPPEPVQYQGPAAIASFLLSLGWWGHRAVRLVPVRANGQPAFGYYLRGPAEPAARRNGLFAITIEAGQIVRLTRFGNDNISPEFGLPDELLR
jgi:RNA polymerase sigma-70 factor (TIGR02960 family)